MKKRILTTLCLLVLMHLVAYTPSSSLFFQLPTAHAQDASNTGTGEGLDIFEGPDSETFKKLNPLNMFGSPYAQQFSSPAGIINRALTFAFPIAGLILFVMLVWGGFEMVLGATDKKSIDQGRQRISAALVGFGLLYASFWIIQIVEYIFNVVIL